MDEFDAIPVEGVGTNLLYFSLELRDPVQVVVNELFDLLLRSVLIKQRKEFQLEHQVIGMLRNSSGISIADCWYSSACGPRYRHEKPLGCGKGHCAALVCCPRLIGGFRQGNPGPFGIHKKAGVLTFQAGKKAILV